MSATYSTSQVIAEKAMTLESLLKVKQEFEKLSLDKKWTLVAPDGRMWQGMPNDLLQVLMPLHPLLQPLGLGEILGASHE